MAKPINHDLASGTLTAASSAAKWGLLGAALPFALPVALGIGTYFGATALFAAAVAAAPVGITTGTFLYTAAAATVAVVGTIATVASTAIAAGWATIGGLGGGLFGLAKGGSRVSAENAAYREYASTQSQTRQQALTRKITDAEIAAEQRGYVIGAQDAEARIANQLQAMSMQQQSALNQAEQTTAGAASAVATATASAKCACGPFTEAELRKQATASANVTPQVG